MNTISTSLQTYFESLGISGTLETVLTMGVLIAASLLFAFAAHRLTRCFLRRTAHSIISRTTNSWDDKLIEHKIFGRLSHVVPALLVYFSAEIVFPNTEGLALFTKRAALSYFIVASSLVVDGCLNLFVDIFRGLNRTKDIPIRSYAQVVKIVLSLVTSILVLATLLDKSPWALLSGLGAMTAVILLVFKDSILGLVSSVQLSAYDLIRVGDWIEYPKYGADGDVLDVSLNVVTIQNWDKTVSTIPTYAFMEGGYKNWRGMSESGGRRIKRALCIDMSTIRFCDQELLSQFRSIDILKSYLTQRLEEVRCFNKERGVGEAATLNGRHLTNFGTFRHYVEAYLRNHSKIHQGMTLLVRQLAPNEKGLPLEIYCFSSDQNWTNYEEIQADIFDHLIAILPEFDLKVFQAPSGNDFRAAIGS